MIFLFFTCTSFQRTFFNPHFYPCYHCHLLPLCHTTTFLAGEIRRAYLLSVHDSARFNLAVLLARRRVINRASTHAYNSTIFTAQSLLALPFHYSPLLCLTPNRSIQPYRTHHEPNQISTHRSQFGGCNSFRTNCLHYQSVTRTKHKIVRTGRPCSWRYLQKSLCGWRFQGCWAYCRR